MTETSQWEANGTVVLPSSSLSRLKASTADISAIIPIYNGLAHIEHAVESVTAQTLSPCELILIDDGSMCDQFQFLKGYEAPIPIRILRQANAGQSAARNYGATLATGSYLAFLDQDDLWYPNHLEVLRSRFRKTRKHDLGWVYSNLDRIDESGAMHTRYFLNHVEAAHPKRSLTELLREDLMILPSAALIKKEAFESVSGFDTALMGYEDDDLFLRMFRAGWDNEFINEPLSQWRIHSQSCSYSPRMAESRRFYMNKLLETFPDNPEFGEFWVRDNIAPRFIKNWNAEYLVALQQRNNEACMQITHDLQQLAELQNNQTLIRKLQLMTHPALYRMLRSGWQKIPRPIRHVISIFGAI